MCSEFETLISSGCFGRIMAIDPITYVKVETTKAAQCRPYDSYNRGLTLTLNLLINRHCRDLVMHTWWPWRSYPDESLAIDRAK